MIIRGTTRLIAHIGYPTHTFKSPMIYNPYFETAGIDALVTPMSVQAEAFTAFLPAIFSMTNIIGALITMPHKVTSAGLLAELSPSAQIAGACNAVIKRADGSLYGDMFDGEGFVRGMQRKGFAAAGASVLVVGSGGVGSAIAASLAAAGVARMALFDTRPEVTEALAARLRQHYPALAISLGERDPAGKHLVVNATPVGMNPGDPLPMDVTRIAPGCFVGEVVMTAEMTPFLQQAKARDCVIQVGTDMLFEQIPAYLEFFGLPSTTPEHLRAVARLSY
ncbi:shikimate dehydrogenase family protein [Pseudomonas sp. NPDC007930]|uniref:shikimate dehydrogenase family protein n=1 Tax=Pseudomonas sp. NPDC007930 TaxID=3364417 RepID=UPI0036E2729C